MRALAIALQKLEFQNCIRLTLPSYDNARIKRILVAGFSLCNPEQKHYRSWFCVSKYVVVALNGTLNTQSAPSGAIAESW
jgi:hypothetical protein